ARRAVHRAVEADGAARDVQPLSIGLEGAVAHPHGPLDARGARQLAAKAHHSFQAGVDAAADDADFLPEIDLDVGADLHPSGIDARTVAVAAFPRLAPRVADDADVAGQLRHAGAAQFDQALVGGHFSGQGHPAAVAREARMTGDHQALARVQRRTEPTCLEVE